MLKRIIESWVWERPQKSNLNYHWIPKRSVSLKEHTNNFLSLSSSIGSQTEKSLLFIHTTSLYRVLALLRAVNWTPEAQGWINTDSRMIQRTHRCNHLLPELPPHTHQTLKMGIRNSKQCLSGKNDSVIGPACLVTAYLKNYIILAKEKKFKIVGRNG